MGEPIQLDSDLPKDWRSFRMPAALRDRLTQLLDQLDHRGKLSPREKREAKALTELVDVLALLKAKAALIGSRR